MREPSEAVAAILVAFDVFAGRRKRRYQNCERQEFEVLGGSHREAPQAGAISGDCAGHPRSWCSDFLVDGTAAVLPHLQRLNSGAAFDDVLPDIVREMVAMPTRRPAGRDRP